LLERESWKQLDVALDGVKLEVGVVGRDPVRRIGEMSTIRADVTKAGRTHESTRRVLVWPSPPFHPCTAITVWFA
jgi:hypothetical protein